MTTSYRWLLSGPCTLQSISCPAGGRSAESPLPASEIRLPASELLQRSPHRPSRSTPPQLPTRACLLASALICAAQLEGFPPWILGKRKAVCESTSIRAVCRLLSGSKQYVRWGRGRCQSEVVVRAKALALLSCCFVVTENNVLDIVIL